MATTESANIPKKNTNNVLFISLLCLLSGLSPANNVCKNVVFKKRGCNLRNPLSCFVLLHIYIPFLIFGRIFVVFRGIYLKWCFFIFTNALLYILLYYFRKYLSNLENISFGNTIFVMKVLVVINSVNKYFTKYISA